MRVVTALLLMVGSAGAATVPMDSERGDKLFTSQGCVQCHRLKGEGGKTAPDLGRVLDRGYAPADLVSTMWNHAPTMWAAIKEQGIVTGNIDRQAAADLFAAFLSARFFEMRGDAGRGKKLFEARNCATCHGIKESPNGRAKPVSEWRTLSDPAVLVGAMWNHSPDMWRELSKKKMPWPTLASQDLSDLLVYLRNAATPAHAGQGFRISETENAAKLFEEKGCAACHKTGEPQARLTLTGVAAAMWNHASLLRAEPPHIDANEMRELLSYYWAKRFFDVPGDAAHGRRVYAAKKCATCHAGAGPGPMLSAKAGSYTAITMLSSLWRHGPKMLAEMKEKKIAWPQFRAGEMEDLIAALNDPKTGK
jgi:cytochrome c2